MEKSELIRCLQKVFLNAYDPYESSFLKKLSSLLAYYSSDDLRDLSQDINKLHSIILKHEIYTASHVAPPSRFHCSLDARQNVPNFTFSPQISIGTNDDLDSALSFSKDLEDVNLYALICYVKEKAIAAGDFYVE